jgi:three-Cys-motif partner protein
MGSKDLHVKPFDEATLTKLELFGDYAESWIPTIVMADFADEVHIFDFFAGPGYDNNGIAGSPIRLLEKVEKQIGNLFNKKTKVTIHLNEYNKDKFNQLVENCVDFLNSYPRLRYVLNIKYYTADSAELLPKLLPIIKKHPSLVFLDQNGVKFISREYLGELEKLSTTDFLFFVSSSYFKWLGTTPEFQKVIPFTNTELKSIEWTNIHRKVVDKLRSFLKPDSNLSLYPFTIKKGSNIYGVIFGASHPAAVDKFLTLCWKKNKINGEANFDLHDDKGKAQTELFGKRRLTKVEQFKKDLEEKVLGGEIENNKEALDFTYRTGNYYRHANEVLKRLKKIDKIDYGGKTPGINYDNVIKKRNLITYRLK